MNMKTKAIVYLIFPAFTALAVNFPLPPGKSPEDFYRLASESSIVVGPNEAEVHTNADGTMHWPGPTQPVVTYTNSQAWWTINGKAGPTEFPNGIAIPAQTNGTPVYGIIATPDGDLVTYIDHASPRDPAAAASNRAAAIVSREQIRTALKTVKANIATSIDNCTTNIADMALLSNLTNGFTAAENRSLVNALRRELEDADREMKAVTQELRDVRKALSQSLKDASL